MNKLKDDISNFLQADCPKCGEKQPALRIPENVNQALWGGWTCPNCGCKMDRKGNEIIDKK